MTLLEHNLLSRFAGDLHLISIVGTFLAVYVFGRIITLLYLHPLHRFPGPRIAAITRWYEFYHDVIRDGTYVKYYPTLHKKYGQEAFSVMIVQVMSPNFLNCRANNTDCSKPLACQ